MRNRFFQLLAVLMVLAISASACGSDSSDVVAGSNDSAEQDSDTGDTRSSDSDSDGVSSSPDTDDSDTGDSSSDSSGTDGAGDSDAVASSGEVDCSDISSAIETAGGLVGGDPNFFAESDPEQQFEVARQTLAVLKTQIPEIADDVDAMSEGLEAIASAYAEIGWDTDFESDPAAAVKLAQTAFSDPAVSAMIASAANIGLWMATNCL